MKSQLTRLALASAASLTLAAAMIGTASAAQPYQDSWTNHSVDPGYFDCNGVPITGDWMVTHQLTIYFDKSGTPTSDRERIDFVGAFVNPATGDSIADSGQSIYFDTLDANYNYLTTMQNGVRHSAYFHSAGRFDFQTGASTGVDQSEKNFAAACAALGAPLP